MEQAWIQEDVPQCGYCQSGQIMAAAILLRDKPNPTDGDIDDAMTGNICRCGTYQRIRKAIHVAAGLKKSGCKVTRPNALQNKPDHNSLLKEIIMRKTNRSRQNRISITIYLLLSVGFISAMSMSLQTRTAN